MTSRIEPIDFQGLPAIQVHGPGGCRAIVSLFGGQLLSWVTGDQRERLYLSDQAVFDGKTAVRGGVPVCFPQFGTLGALPKHGFARQLRWQVESQRATDEFAMLTLVLEDDEETRALWPYAFRAEMTFMLESDRLDLEFCVDNTGTEDFSFSGALHTYLNVIQVEDVALEGLYGHHYRDAVTQLDDQVERAPQLSVEGEVDRAYFEVSRPLSLVAGNHSLTIQGRGFPDVVVWNPWKERAAALPDMPNEDWRHMLCVEAAIARVPVLLPSGESWTGRQTLVLA